MYIQHQILELQRHFNLWVKRFKLVRTIYWGVTGLVTGWVFSLFLAFYKIYFEGITQEEYFLTTVSIILLFMAVFGLARYLYPENNKKLAFYIDTKLHLAERLTTALEIIENHGAIEKEIENPLNGLQVQDTVTKVIQLEINKNIPFHIYKWQKQAFFSLTIFSVMLFFFGNPVFLQTEIKRDQEKAIEQEAADIKELINQVETDNRLSATEKNAINKPLNELTQTLENTASLETSIAALEETKRDLNSLYGPDNLKNLSEKLTATREQFNTQNTNLNQFTNHLSAGDIDSALDDLRNLNLKDQSPENLSAMRSQLNAFAQSISSEIPELANQFQNASTNIENNNLEEAEKFLGEAAETIEDMNFNEINDSMVQKAVEVITSSQESLLQTSHSTNNDLQTPSSELPKSGSEQISGSSSGDNIENQTGNTGSGTGDIENANFGGNEAGIIPIQTGNAISDGGIGFYDPVFASNPLEILEPGENLVLPEGGEIGENPAGEGPLSLPNPSPVTVPYNNVFPKYYQTAKEAIIKEQMPFHLESLIQKYFSNIEP